MGDGMLIPRRWDVPQLIRLKITNKHLVRRIGNGSIKTLQMGEDRGQNGRVRINFSRRFGPMANHGRYVG
jgi:hypothetical protein